MGYIKLKSRLMFGTIAFFVIFIGSLFFKVRVTTAFIIGIIFFLIVMVMGSKSMDDYEIKARAERKQEERTRKESYDKRKGELDAEEDHKRERDRRNRRPFGLVDAYHSSRRRRR